MRSIKQRLNAQVCCVNEQVNAQVHGKLPIYAKVPLLQSEEWKSELKCTWKKKDE